MPGQTIYAYNKAIKTGCAVTAVHVDVDLTGMIMGMTLATRPEDIYRALIEATAYDTREIIDAFTSSGLPITRFYACGGIAAKDPLMMQIYADVTRREINISEHPQTVALGAAMFGAVAAGKYRGGYDKWLNMLVKLEIYGGNKMSKLPMIIENIPQVNLGLIAVSRDCFPMELSRRRRDQVLLELEKRSLDILFAETVVENEMDAVKAIAELKEMGANALVVYLGNFGPEGPETLLAKLFDGPVMYVAAAEETRKNLISGRGDALCGLLNASYNLALRNLPAYIPEYPVGDASAVAGMIQEFIPSARALIGIRGLKVISFGPRPDDFLACNAPIKCLYDMGASIQENSELDLLVAYRAHENDSRIPGVIADMAAELGSGNDYPGILGKLAQYELTLLDWYEKNKGAARSVVFANKCWPAFQTEFQFVPCYVNSRLAARGIPVACETDIYGAFSEFILACATLQTPTLLDINNSVPYDMIEKNAQLLKDYQPTDLVMNFHCGNTSVCSLKPGTAAMKYQLIMKSLLEPDGEPDITRGTLEGTLQSGATTLFRIQATADGNLRSYIAEGEVLDIDPQSFGAIGVFAVPEFGRFYRHVLIEKNYPHHAGVVFCKAGRTLFAVARYLGIKNIDYNQPRGILYPSENPFV